MIPFASGFVCIGFVCALFILLLVVFSPLLGGCTPALLCNSLNFFFVFYQAWAIPWIKMGALLFFLSKKFMVGRSPHCTHTLHVHSSTRGAPSHKIFTSLREKDKREKSVINNIHVLSIGISIPREIFVACVVCFSTNERVL